MGRRRALDFLTRITILSHPLQRDAAFGITGALRGIVEQLGYLPRGAPLPTSARSRPGRRQQPDWMQPGVLVPGQRVALGAQRPPGPGNASSVVDLGLAQLFRRLAHDETACYMVYRGNEWVGDVR